jgi:hypothetical protein
VHYFAFTVPSARTPEAPRQSAIRNTFILQDEMRWLPARQRLEPLAHDHPNSLLVINGECLTATRAQPEMLDGMAVRGRGFLPWKLLKTKKTSLAKIKIGRAIRMGAFQIHQLRVAPFLMDSNIHLKRKIRFGYAIVKLIYSMLRIYAPGGSVMIFGM